MQQNSSGNFSQKTYPKPLVTCGDKVSGHKLFKTTTPNLFTKLEEVNNNPPSAYVLGGLS
ncbi:hypothetical protein HMPREF0044_1526 [Gleimia coleocanis DSM 15436]|uniref:Uncharacterized protein n=1 Tax=Gleimia coleocanis DSM 15436 TaxID=525245 RepID=C0W273_9ACTO|nr:hypothetical protein HMPREF0044_1526 [Gleimia coleocanis DSM 15436]